MERNLFIIVLCFFIISCSSVPNKDHQQQKIVEETTTFLESSKTKGILESLTSDLRKLASQIMNENEEAQIINKDMIIYGKGIDLNGNGRVWNTYEDGGAGLMLVTGKPSAIIFSASTDFISLY